MSAWTDNDERTSVERRAAVDRMPYADKIADLSRRAAQIRRDHPGRYVEPSTPWGTFTAPLPSETREPEPEDVAEVIEFGRPEPRLEEVDGFEQWEDGEELPF
jgi:hypothetical protein